MKRQARQRRKDQRINKTHCVCDVSLTLPALAARAGGLCKVSQTHGLKYLRRMYLYLQLQL